ncbi:translation initiation factor IF-2-like isoform X1 [Gallus gallus]|uniref:translation initiation factor IF-2-like isoform X1 n=1 Tax=Gallus gallus TaxID=9031 RepID=UPI001F01348E|nr:translation initiation factor IF-2-like isoform X1 [Gallus gallus]
MRSRAAPKTRRCLPACPPPAYPHPPAGARLLALTRAASAAPRQKHHRRSRGGLRRALSGGGGTSAERQRRGPTGGGGGFRPAAAWRGVSCAGVGCVGREAGPALTGGVRAAGRRPIGASHTRLREAGAGRCGYSAARVKRKAGARGDGQGPRPMSGRVLRPRGEGGRAAFPGSCLKGARPPARLVVVLIGQRAIVKGNQDPLFVSLDLHWTRRTCHSEIWRL